MILNNSYDHDFYQRHQLSPPSQLFDLQVDTFYFAKNRDGFFVYANQLLAEHFGVSSVSEIVGKNDFDIFGKEHAKRFRQDDILLMENDNTMSNKLELVPDADDNPQWFVTFKSPLKDPNGNIVGIEGLTRDVVKTQLSIEPYNDFFPCIEFIQQNYMNRISVQHLAEICCMSVSTFERRFKKHFGSTPSNFIKRLRIEQACKLLIAGYHIHHVALEAGFCDQSYFTREFRKIMGITPRRYLQMNKQVDL